MSGEIDFETGELIWGAEITHNTPDTPGFWTGAFNAENQDTAIVKAIGLFEKDGLPPARITKMRVYELKTLEGGEDA